MGTCENSSPVSKSSISEWDRPFTYQELQAIEAAFQSATSSSSSPMKTRQQTSQCSHIRERRLRVRRRLPDSLAGNHQPTASPALRGFGREGSPIMRTPDSFSLSRCRRNQFFDVYSDSSQAKLMMRYPELSFRGQIVYSRTVDEVEKAAKELLEIVETKKSRTGQVVLGFDIEWRPTFRRGVPPGKVAVMQICGDTSQCYVMHIIHSGIPQSLQSLLEDPTVLKVGVGIANDALKVFKDYNVSVKSLEDLSGLANQKLGDLKKWSLAALAEMLICKELPKPGKIRLGNWEKDILSKEKLEYAATDAFASWFLYQALKSLPDAAANTSEGLENGQLK